MDITNIIRRECARLLGRWARTRHLLVTSYDPKTNSVKGTFQPEGHMSGWIPIQTHSAGKPGISIQVGPSIGDLALVGHAEGDPEAAHVVGFKHNDQDPPPGATSGQYIIKHNPTSVQHTLDKNGHDFKAPDLLISHSAKNITHTADESITHTAKNITHNVSQKYQLNASSGFKFTGGGDLT